MPQTLLGKKYSPKPKTNLFAAVYRQKMKEQGLNTVSLGKLMSTPESTVRTQLLKPIENWTVGNIKSYCKAINWSLKDAFATVIKSI